MIYGFNGFILRLTTPAFSPSRTSSGQALQRRGMLAFVGGGFVECDEVEHGSHSASDSVAVLGFDFGGGKVGGDVGLDVFGYEEVVAT